MTHEAVESSRPKNCFHWQQICHCYCHRRWRFILRPVVDYNCFLTIETDISTRDRTQENVPWLRRQGLVTNWRNAVDARSLQILDLTSSALPFRSPVGSTLISVTCSQLCCALPYIYHFARLLPLVTGDTHQRTRLLWILREQKPHSCRKRV